MAIEFLRDENCWQRHVPVEAPGRVLDQSSFEQGANGVNFLFADIFQVFVGDFLVEELLKGRDYGG